MSGNVVRASEYAILRAMDTAYVKASNDELVAYFERQREAAAEAAKRK